jgi:hypothetical protein
VLQANTARFGFFHAHTLRVLAMTGCCCEELLRGEHTAHSKQSVRAGSRQGNLNTVNRNQKPYTTCLRHVALLTVVRVCNVGKRPRRCGDVLQRCCASVTEIPHISSRCSAPSTQHRSPLTTSGQINLINCCCDPVTTSCSVSAHGATP